MPIGNASEQFLGLLALTVSNGAMIIDHETGQAAGNLLPFVRSGLIDEAKQIPLADLQEVHIDTNHYDTHFKPGAYLRSHAEHMKLWHSVLTAVSG
jgi:hypothetical protein